mmetsp:Transcript_11310/g.21301  ORF Transcript_11310/g.21301 Transcript_11310/m.21301 type:complete len:332 (+) Transcript_11310:35-1030(+)
MPRACSQPWTAVQAIYEWAQYIVQGAARCASGPSNGDVGTGRVAWDALVPRYHPTTVASLEERRENLSLALMGQLSIVFCRLLTGHLGACGIGLIIFVVGNNARCSLQVSELTCYVALGGCAGTIDAFDLISHFLQGGHHLVLALPFADNLASNLEVFSLWMSPMAELMGARTAYGCYLNPSMLFEFEAPNPQMSLQSQYGQPIFHAGHFAAAGFRSVPPRPSDPMRTRMPGVWGDVASMMPGWPGMMDARSQPMGSGNTEGQFPGYDSEGYASSSRDRPHAVTSQSKRRNDSEVCCTGCGDAVPPGEGWLGTGAFYGQVYCARCWSSWRN